MQQGDMVEKERERGASRIQLNSGLGVFHACATVIDDVDDASQKCGGGWCIVTGRAVFNIVSCPRSFINGLGISCKGSRRRQRSLGN